MSNGKSIFIQENKLVCRFGNVGDMRESLVEKKIRMDGVDGSGRGGGRGG